MYVEVLKARDRRSDPRFRVQVYLNQYIADSSYRAIAFDISEAGLAIQKLNERVVRSARMVGLEFELPGTREVIWASAESRFDRVGEDFHVSGLRFSAMALKHRRILYDYLRERRTRLAHALGSVPHTQRSLLG